MTREKTKPQTVISLWFHVASDWLQHNWKCQNQIKSVHGFWIRTVTPNESYQYLAKQAYQQEHKRFVFFVTLSKQADLMN